MKEINTYLEMKKSCLSKLYHESLSPIGQEFSLEACSLNIRSKGFRYTNYLKKNKAFLNYQFSFYSNTLGENDVWLLEIKGFV